MSSRYLPVIRANADFQLTEMAPVLADGRIDAEWYAIFCRAYRMRGISSLFIEGAARLLHADLQRSGTAFAQFLRGAPDAVKVTSKSSPFFDAVGCGDWETARAISRYSRSTWSSAEEYEDDFLYVWFLMKRFFLGEGEAGLGALVLRYEAVLEGAVDPRLDVCKAFMSGDASSFESALEDLVEQHRDRYQQAKEEDRITEEEWATEGQFFVEGLALARLAEQSGMQIQSGYQFIPSIALAASASTFDPDSWRSP